LYSSDKSSTPTYSLT